MSNVSDGAFFEKIENDLLVVKNFMVLPHYPRKITYLKNILKIILKKKEKNKTSSFVIEGKIYIYNYSRLYLPCRKTSRPKDSNYCEVMLGFY